MMDLSAFEWIPARRIWLRSPRPGSRLEIAIPGDEQGPQADRMPVVKEALARVDDIRAQSIAYLDAFVERAKFAQNSDWYMDCIEFGCCADEPVNELTVYFTLEDDFYGLWSVRVRRTQHTGFVPFELSRRQQ